LCHALHWLILYYPTELLKPRTIALMSDWRIGFGEDAHQLAAGRPLVIGGVSIAGSERGALAHSDGDVLLHALADALLSAFALGDIGHYFPPSDAAYKDMDSAEILQQVMQMIHQQAGPFTVQNVAAVVTLDAPKLGGYRAQIGARLASLLGLSPERVGITFKTSEGLAPAHIQARVTVLLQAS
jgi:2-C-methyl-D-erythritol 2,4-cyclodiphosphate synthase